MKQFAIWEVDGQEYKLKLTTSAICQLEEKFKTNLLNLVDEMPSLTTMLTVTHAAIKDWNHGIKYADVQNLFDKYCEAGGSQTDFMADVFIEIYNVSGFFSQALADTMTEKIAEAKEQI